MAFQPVRGAIHSKADMMLFWSY